MTVHRVVSDLLLSNMYIVEEDGWAIIVDPCQNNHTAVKWTPEWLFLTHEHYDHISGVNQWKMYCGAPVLCSMRCGERIQNTKENMARYFKSLCCMQKNQVKSVPDDYEPSYTCKASAVFVEDTEFTWRGHVVKLILLPGHSPGSAGLLIDNCLFSGDSLFDRQETELRFPGGSEKEWKEISLPKLRALPPDTIVYPGHFRQFLLKDWNAYKEETNVVLCQ